MARKRTGLRNRYRSGRGTYSRQRKSESADRYGAWKDGRRQQPERIAGRLLP